jgi:hypothetical protein
MGSGPCRETEMRRRVVSGVLGLSSLAVCAFLLFRTRQPTSISRAVIASANFPRAAPGDTMPETNLPLPLSRREETPTGAESKPSPFGIPRYAPRAADEWQGMLINLNITPPCGSSENCGMARACLEEKCMPCEKDEQCVAAEVCVLQHCLVRELVTCRHAAECGPDSKCILSGYSNQPRGNEGIRAYCVSALSGATKRPHVDLIPPELEKSLRETRAVPEDELAKAARRAARDE